MIQHYKDGLHSCCLHSFVDFVYRRWKVRSPGMKEFASSSSARLTWAFPATNEFVFVLCTFFQVQSQILSIHLQIYFCLAGSPGFHKERQDLDPSSVKNFLSHTLSDLRDGRHAVKSCGRHKKWECRHTGMFSYHEIHL